MRNSTNLNLSETSKHFSEVSSEKIFLPDESEFAVLKIDLSGKILYANHASFAPLADWLSCRNETLPGYFIKQHPDILNPEADFSFSISVKSNLFSFDVIGFKESGYIGLYGFDAINVSEIINHLTELEKSEALIN